LRKVWFRKIFIHKLTVATDAGSVGKENWALEYASFFFGRSKGVLTDGGHLSVQRRLTTDFRSLRIPLRIAAKEEEEEEEEDESLNS
jgi:hypothetical protein